MAYKKSVRLLSAIKYNYPSKARPCKGCPTRFTSGWCETHQRWMPHKCQEGRMPTRNEREVL